MIDIAIPTMNIITARLSGCPPLMAEYMQTTARREKKKSIRPILRPDQITSVRSSLACFVRHFRQPEAGFVFHLCRLLLLAGIRKNHPN